jgi:hypothetical protein
MSPAAVATPEEALHRSALPRAKPQPDKLVSSPDDNIIDIRRVALEINLKDDILNMWNDDSAPRKLPTMLLYNERGLQLFEDVGPPPRPSFPRSALARN